MASPQTENGYTKISNELMQALARVRIAGEYRQVLDVIFYKTYGWHKKWDAISLSQFVIATGMKKPSVCRALRMLIKMNMISEKANAIATSYSINKDFDTWIPLSKKITLAKKLMSVSEKANPSLTKKLHTQTTTTKTIITKTAQPSADAIRLAHLLYEYLKQIHAQYKEPNFTEWAKHFDDMIRIDHRTIEEIEYVMNWCQGDPYYKAHVQTPSKLRQQYDFIATIIKSKK